MQGGKQPGSDHPIHIEPAGQRVVVRIGDTILAESSNALLLSESHYPPVFYIPREEVAMDELVPTSHRSHCPYKGDASYFSVPAGGARSENAAWSYEDPFEAMAAIKGHIAFYPDRVDAIESAIVD